MRAATNAQETAARRYRPRRRWFVVAATLAVALILLASIVPSERGGSAATAAQELQRIARVASSQPETPVPPDGKFRVERESLRPVKTQFLGSGASFTVVTRVHVQGTIRTDASGEFETLVRDAEFASEQDRQVWLEAGSPEIPRAGDVSTESFETGEMAFYDLAGLPTDADALWHELRRGDVTDLSAGPDNLFSEIGTLLAQPDASPELRAALFELASTIEGVTLAIDTTDPLGRPGVGISLISGAYRSELIVEESTSAILAIVDHPAPGQTDVQPQWTAFVV